MTREKKKKIIDIAVNCIVTVIMVAVLIITINILVSFNKGYVPMFGRASVAIQTDSMDNAAEPINFRRGDIVKIRLIDEEETSKLREGHVIAFYNQGLFNDLPEKAIIVHKIVGIDPVGNIYTNGTNPNNSLPPVIVSGEDIIGIVPSQQAVTRNLGKVTLWFRSPTGFGVCIVLPAVLIVAYCVYLVAKATLEMKKRHAEIDDKERMRREILAELGIDPDAATADAGTDAQGSAAAEETAEAVAVEEAAVEPTEVTDGPNE